MNAPPSTKTLFTKLFSAIFGPCAASVAAALAFVELATRAAGGRTEELARLTRLVHLGGAFALVLSFAFAWRVARSVSLRIGLVTEDAELFLEDARCRRAEAEAEKRRGDEKHARIGELSERNSELRAVLDHVEQGFVVLDQGGRMGNASSRALEEWFGAPAVPRETFADYIGRIDANTGRMIELGYELLVSDDMPREVAIAALPMTLYKDGRQYRIDYTPIGLAEEPITNVLVAVTDVTELVAGEREDEMRREVHEVFEKALADRNGYFNFHAEAEEIISGILSGQLEPSEERRGVHTLKGNAALFGLRAFGKFCHELEAQMRDDEASLRVADRVALAARWKAATNRLTNVFMSRRDRIEVEKTELDAFHEALVAGAPRPLLARRVRSWRLEPFAVRLEHFAEQARELADRLGKPGLVVDTNGAGLRFDPVAWAPFWAAFVHVVRNAVDHGIEMTAAERTGLGKPVDGLLALEVSLEDRHLVLAVSDDGPGIDWTRLERRASAAGLAMTTEHDRVTALFADGVSTMDAVSETSGRGVGLSAVRKACARLGGVIEVESTKGVGTRFRFVFPRDAMGTVYEPTPAAPIRRDSGFVAA